jgi:hypothetical protein
MLDARVNATAVAKHCFRTFEIGISARARGPNLYYGRNDDLFYILTSGANACLQSGFPFQKHDFQYIT